MTHKQPRPPAYTRRSLELRTAEYYASVRKPKGEWKTLEDLSPQLAEYEHYVTARDYDKAAQLLDLIDADYLYQWGYYTHVIKLREKLLKKLQYLSFSANNLRRLGNAYYEVGNREDALKCYQQALLIAQESRDRLEESAIFGKLGVAHYDLGNIEKAKKYVDIAVSIAREIQNRRMIGIQVGRLGMIYRNLGQLSLALDCYRESLPIMREVKDYRYQADQSSGLGLVYYQMGQMEQSLSLFQESLSIARQINFRWGESLCYGYLGLSYQALGELDKAVHHFKEALNIAREIGHRQRQSVWLGTLGDVFYALGRTQQAFQCYEESLLILREIHDVRIESYQLLGLCRMRLGDGELQDAYHLAQTALDFNVPETNYQIALMLGIVCLYNSIPQAQAIFTDAINRCQSRLKNMSRLYKPCYVLAAARVGQAICDPRWRDSNQRTDLLAPALAEYCRSLDITAAPGVVSDALRDLELIRAAGIDGLEPVFTLLEQAIADWQPLPDDALSSSTSLWEDTL